MLRSNNMARAIGRTFDRTYDRLEKAAIAAARRNNAMLLYVPDAPGAAHQNSSTGYAPALAGSPIGRLLDMQYGAPKFGPELLANPRFNSDASSWSPYANTTLAAVGGKLRMGTTTGPSQPMLAIAAVATIPGQTYQLFAASAAKTSQVGVFQLQATNNASGAGAYASASFGTFGTQSISDMALIFVASATVTYVVLRADGGASATTADYSDWDNVSARQIIDAPTSRGAELVTNGNFAAWSGDNPVGWGLSYTETATEFVTQASPGARIVATTGNFNEIAQNVGLTIGATYEVIVQVTACTGSGSVSNASASPISFNAPGWYRGIFTAVGGSIGLKRSTGGSASDFTVASISCKEVPGYHCTQPTAANKPTLVKVPRRTGPELVANGDFTTDLSSWATANTGVATVTWSAGTALFNTNGVDGARIRQQVFVTPGKTYWITVNASPSLNVALGANPGTTEYVSYFAGNRAFAFVAPTDNFWINTVTAVNGAYLDRISVVEVLEWSNAIDLNGTGNWMDVTFRDYFGATGGYTFVGSWVGPVSGNSATVLAQSNSANTNPFVSPLFVAVGSNHASIFERGDSGATGLVGSAYAISSFLWGDCVELQQSASAGVGNFKGWRKGQPHSDVNYTSVTESLTTNKVTLGAAQRTSIANFAKGTFALLCWAPRVMPVADRKAIARFASYLIGANYNG